MKIVLGGDVIHSIDGLKIPAALIGHKNINGKLFPIIQYLAPNGELYNVKDRPYWLDLTMVVNHEEIEAC